MKKILLATTMLTMTAGYAAADVVWGADANIGIAQNGTKNDGRPQAGDAVGTDPETYTDEIDA
ncbi:MAG: porin, partial [Alphaproteobacteria bacterium]